MRTQIQSICLPISEAQVEPVDLCDVLSVEHEAHIPATARCQVTVSLQLGTKIGKTRDEENPQAYLKHAHNYTKKRKEYASPPLRANRPATAIRFDSLIKTGCTPTMEHGKVNRSAEKPVIACDAGQAILKCPESVPAGAATSLNTSRSAAPLRGLAAAPECHSDPHVKH
eukprot:6203785-Pleurochrysis_carterae.AAC.6